MIFTDAELDLLARAYAFILSWPDKEADCDAGSETQSAGCGDVDESAIDILPDVASGEELSQETEHNNRQQEPEPRTQDKRRT